MSTSEQQRRAASIAASRSVRFEVLADDEVVGGELVHSGLRVDLLAPSMHAAGCPHEAQMACPTVFADLALIARTVLPSAVRDTSYFLDRFDHSLHIDPQRHYEGDVRLTVHLRHRDGSHGPVDACQRQCVREISSALHELGVTRR